MNLSNAWENFSNIYSSFSFSLFLSEKSRQSGEYSKSLFSSARAVFTQGQCPQRLHLFTTAWWVQSCVRFLNRLKIYNTSTVHCVNVTRVEKNKRKIAILKQLTYFKWGLNTLLDEEWYKSSKYSCGDCGVVCGWQNHQSYDICGLEAFSSLLLTCYTPAWRVITILTDPLWLSCATFSQ